mmetsp:Transcript_6541/g.9696  ORF Transcript_6541/g.9696 Transcript_6541/m.9696 type:complete len:259 (-) Transcript_6541:29-805(-)
MFAAFADVVFRRIPLLSQSFVESKKVIHLDRPVLVTKEGDHWRQFFGDEVRRGQVLSAAEIRVAEDDRIGSGRDGEVILVVVGRWGINHGRGRRKLAAGGRAGDHDLVGVDLQGSRVGTQEADRGLGIFDARKRHLDFVPLLKTVVDRNGDHAATPPVSAVRVVPAGLSSGPAASVKNNECRETGSLLVAPRQEYRHLQVLFVDRLVRPGGIRDIRPGGRLDRQCCTRRLLVAAAVGERPALAVREQRRVGHHGNKNN